MGAAEAEHPAAGGQAGEGCFAGLSGDAQGDNGGGYFVDSETGGFEAGSTPISMKIAARIKDIDAFYNRSALDPRAKYIYATRSLLAKVVEQQN